MKNILTLSLAVSSFLSCASGFAQNVHSSFNPYEGTSNFSEAGKRPNAAYDQIFPLYVVECSGTQTEKIGAKKGGPFGHTLVYLKGACRDTSVAFPKIRKCAPGEKDLSSPEGGIAISLDMNFANTRFIATDGLDLMMNGGLNENGKLDTASVNSVVKKIVDSGAARGIKMKTIAAKPAGMSTEEFTARSTLATSFALRYGRNLRCVSIPINEAKLDSAVNWINTQNADLTSGKSEFHWGIGDECVHFSHNILAAMGIGEPVKTRTGKLEIGMLLSSLLWKPWAPLLQIPMNEVLSSAERAGEAKIPSAEDVFTHAKEREIFKKFHSLAPSDGVLVWAANVHANDNEVYGRDAEPLFMQLPFIRNRSKKMQRILSKPSDTVLEANLSVYQTRVKSAINSQASLEKVVAYHHRLDTLEFRQFYRAYTEYLKNWDAKIQYRRDTLGRLARVH